MSRRRQLPDPVRRRIGTGTRVLGTGDLTGGGLLVVTTVGLITWENEEIHLDRLWSDVDAAGWDSETGTVTVTWVDGAAATDLDVGDGPRTRELVYAIKERVDHSLVLLETVSLPGGGHLRGAIRRNADGSLFSQVTISGVRRPPADVQERAEALEARVRTAVGLD
ncbi:hypothetical protein IM660_10840 [Ruania alkalisoli]|uniref:Uncharacterized protein n=1 Tax=Ruania alkalisoli TaxID=2779775 RepID=A0A7M1SNR7_9MICO|nr:hypothetical protein [Ruania alkalisoli]QOR69216.1 hypothetical protein IM660_10840 [Ruania alkalisoli]